MSKIKEHIEDPCNGCPFYWADQDYWGDYDEGCSAGLDGWYNGKWKFICYMPLFIKKLYKCWYDWKLDRELSKYIEDEGDYLEELGREDNDGF